MLTSTPLVYASPLPSARKPAFKRRRLNHAIDSGCQPSRALTDNSNVAPTPHAPSLSLCAKPSCSTCHRALSTATRPGVASPSTCSRCVASSPAFALPSKVPASSVPPSGIRSCLPHSVLTHRLHRCSAPTCAICSRTCTSYTRPSSLPPTPALTRSPSPSSHVATPVSPKRTALGLSYAAMNYDTSLTLPPPSATSIKRKKAPIDKEDVDGDGDLDGSAVRDHHDVMSTYSGGTESVVIPGCGRVVCRACCVESVPK